MRVGQYVVGYDRGSRTFYGVKAPEGGTPPRGEVGKVGASVFANWFRDENPDDLVKTKGLTVYSDMLTKDESIAAGIRLLALAVVGGGHDVEPFDVEEGAAQEVAVFVEKQLAGLDGPFKAVELGILSGRWAGFSMSENVWGEILEGEFGGKWGLKSIKTKPPYHYGFKLDPFGNIEQLTYDDEMGTTDKWDWQDPAVRNKWVHYAHDAGDAFGSPYGRSALRCVYRYYRARQLAFPMRAIFIEKVAAGVPVMSYPRGILPAEVEAYETMVAKLTSASSMAKPDDVTLEFMEKSGSSHLEFERFDNFCSAGILRGLLVPSQLGIAADTKVGSMAKATVHERLFDWVTGDMDTEETTVINEQIVRPLVDYNYDVEEQYPVFKRKEKDPDDAIAIVTAFISAVSGKTILEVAREDENHVRQLLGFAEVSEREWDERQAAAEERAKQMADAFKESGDDEDEDEGPPSGGKKGGGGKAKTSDTPGGKEKVKVEAETWQDNGETIIVQRGAELARVTRRETWSRIERGLHGSRSRGLTELEGLVGLKPKKVRKRLDRIEDAGVEYIIGGMMRLRNVLLKQLRREGLLDGTGTEKALWEFGGLKGDAKRKFRDGLHTAMVSSYINGATDARKEILKASKGKAEFSRHDAGPQPLQFGVAESLVFDPTDALAYWENLVPMSASLASTYKAQAAWVSGLYLEDHGELLRGIKGVIGKGFETGNWAMVESNINELFKEWVGAGELTQKAVAGGKFTTASPWHTRIIVRNASMRGYNAGRISQMKKAGDWVEAYQWSSIIDSRTSDYCDMMDGVVFRAGEVEPPPAHHQCRSMVTPVVRGMKYQLASRETLLDAVGQRDPGWTSGVIE